MSTPAAPRGRTAVLLSLLVLIFIVGALCWTIGEGPRGVLYALTFVVATLPGWPLGAALFGRRHAASWVAGGLLGYALTAIAIWAAIAAGIPTRGGLLAAWIVVALAAWIAVRRVSAPLVPLPAWSRKDTMMFAAMLLIVPLLAWRPFARFGESDAAGNEQYRAYFTADVLWHVALTSELSRFEMPPRNPYVADRTLHYYWTYFLLPAAAPRVVPGLPHETSARLLVNATCAAMLFVGAIGVLVWSCVPRALPATLAVLLAVVAGGGEGAYALYETFRYDLGWGWLGGVNIDALAAWRFGALRIDGLPRSIWYTPQHAASCALGAVALMVAAHGGARASLRAIGIAGTALGLGLTISPFPAGAFAIIYGVVVLWDSAPQWRSLPRVIARHSIAVLPMLVGLGWCVANATFEGAGDAVRFGLTRMARATTLPVILVKIGPLLLPAIAGLIVTRAARPVRAGAVGMIVGLTVLYFVWLASEPVWIGWRAGQILFITLPVLSAGFFAWTFERAPALALGTALLCLAAGLPTTAIDWFNAQHVDSRQMGPGFRWTVLISPGERAALNWLRRATPREAVVQMDPVARGREAWTTVPTFGERRMAAGLPISLLNTPEYGERSDRVARMFATSDADEAVTIAQDLGIQYIYASQIERHAYADGVAKFDNHPERFAPVFRNDAVTIYAVH